MKITYKKLKKSECICPLVCSDSLESKELQKEILKAIEQSEMIDDANELLSDISKIMPYQQAPKEQTDNPVLNKLSRIYKDLKDTLSSTDDFIDNTDNLAKQYALSAYNIEIGDYIISISKHYNTQKEIINIIQIESIYYSAEDKVKELMLGGYRFRKDGPKGKSYRLHCIGEGEEIFNLEREYFYVKNKNVK